MGSRLTVEEIAAQVVALMDCAPGEYQHGDGMHGDHAFNRVTYDRSDWPKLLAPVEDVLPDGYSVFRAPCGCTWPTSRLDGHPYSWCPSALVGSSNTSSLSPATLVGVPENGSGPRTALTAGGQATPDEEVRQMHSTPIPVPVTTPGTLGGVA